MLSLTPVRVVLVACAVLAAAGCTVQPVAYEPRPRATVLVVMEAPPLLPIYDQPPCPYEGYHWAPGYWGWGAVGYYWVPGTWVMPPRIGVFWTPGYWGFVAGGRYEFHAGYWGERVGYYGGINYGGGYFGSGFVGGRWEGNAYRYNAAVTNVVNVHNVYHETVTNNVTINNVTRVSYSGGQGGARSERTDEERNVARLSHLQATDAQLHHERDAATNPALSARQNQGRPPIAATPRPSAFSAPEVTRARTPTSVSPEESRQAELAHPGPARSLSEDRPGTAGKSPAFQPATSETHRPVIADRPAERDAVPSRELTPQRNNPPAAQASARPATAPHPTPREARRREHARVKSKQDERDARDRAQ